MGGSFYNNFVACCKKKGITPSQACKILGLSHGSVTHWKAGRIPRYETLEQLASFFDVPIESLLSQNATDRYERDYCTPGIPIYGEVSCGSGILAEDSIVGYTAANKLLREPWNYFYLIAKGTSMMPRIENGDYVLIHRCDTIEPGQTGVFLVDGIDGLLKKFQQTEDSIQLISTNPTYPPLVFKKQDIERVKVLGRAVGLVRSF